MPDLLPRPLIEKPSVEQLQDKAFRDAFMSRSVRESIAAQVKTLRVQHGLTSRAFALRVGVSYATISRLENPKANGCTTIQTLLKIASAFDVALMIKFVTWSRWLQETFVFLPTGALQYRTEKLTPSADIMRLLERANAEN